MMQSTGYEKDKTKYACEQVHNSCAICAASGRPADRKISITHVNAAFNDEIQGEYLYKIIRGKHTKS